jgi:hypothetical protein
MTPVPLAASHRRRRVLPALGALGALGALPGLSALTACGGSSAAGTPATGTAAPPAATGETPSRFVQPVAVQPVVPATDLAVGPNRFTLGLLGPTAGSAAPVPLPDAQLTLTFYHPIEPRAVPRSGPLTPQYRYVADRTRGLYVVQVDFDEPGDWGVDVRGTAGGRPLVPAGARFQVKARSDTPAVGAPAPRSHNPTRHDVEDIRRIDSGATPNDMHEVSIAGAIDQGRPLVVLFASPGFCVTQTCAPQLGEVQRLKGAYGDRASFVHVEIFKDPATRTPFETVTEWGLTSEPWTFIVDRQGVVAAKFEGSAPYAELESGLRTLL